MSEQTSAYHVGVTAAQLLPCPYCGSHREPVYVTDSHGEKMLCPECSYIISSWKRSG